ncbi:hypothetical protein O3P69_019998 [Scylla paramamosain]|uniref:Uncharacterized protein n=1 Tax=Scylla paramamosain TaxID=85552 RepID=A0AAW0SCL0_SCYPA
MSSLVCQRDAAAGDRGSHTPESASPRTPEQALLTSARRLVCPSTLAHSSLRQGHGTSTLRERKHRNTFGKLLRTPALSRVRCSSVVASLSHADNLTTKSDRIFAPVVKSEKQLTRPSVSAGQEAGAEIEHEPSDDLTTPPALDTAVTHHPACGWGATVEAQTIHG